MELLRQIEVVDRIILHIEKNFYEMNCLKDIHHMFFMDCPIYETIFLEQVHITINQYIKKVRIEQAVQLLEETQMDVKEVALAVGVYDYFEFVYTFKEVMGVSPSEYRNQICDVII